MQLQKLASSVRQHTTMRRELVGVAWTTHLAQRPPLPPLSKERTERKVTEDEAIELVRDKSCMLSKRYLSY